MENNNYKVNLESLGLFQPIRHNYNDKDENVFGLLKKFNRIQHICRYFTMSNVLRNNIVAYYNQLEGKARQLGKTGVADALAQYCNRLMNAGNFMGNDNRTGREFEFQSKRLMRRKQETKEDIKNLLEENKILGYLFNHEPSADIADKLLYRFAQICQREVDELVNQYGQREEN